MRQPLDSLMVILQGLLLLMHSLTRLSAMAQTFDTHDRRPEEKMPYFVPGDTRVFFHKGDTAVLKCVIEDLGTKTVIWRRASDPNPITIGHNIYVGDGQYTVESNKEKNEWRLYIRDVKVSDSGVYECQISTTEKRIHHILLRVNVTARPQRKNYVNFKKDPPTAASVLPDAYQRPEVIVSGQEYVEKGDPIHLVCNAIGSHGPPRDMVWFKDGIKLTPDGVRQIQIDKFIVQKKRALVSVLDIKHSQMADAGTYVCRSDLTINSTKVHVLNAGSTNVRRGTSATGTKNNKDGGEFDRKGEYNENDNKDRWYRGESSSSSNANGETLQKQRGKTKNPNNSSPRNLSYSPLLVCVMFTVVVFISKGQIRTIFCDSR